MLIMLMFFMIENRGIKDENLPLWKKLTYSIGYSGGICYTGPRLMRECNCPLIPPSFQFYRISSIEGNISCFFYEKRKIEITCGFIIPLELKNREYMGGSDVKITGIYSGIKFQHGNIPFIGINFYGLKEYDSIPYIPPEYDGRPEKHIHRICIGGSIFFGCETPPSPFAELEKIHISGKGFIKFQLGGAWEFWSDASQKDPTNGFVGLSGVFIGFRFEIGTKR